MYIYTSDLASEVWYTKSNKGCVTNDIDECVYVVCDGSGEDPNCSDSIPFVVALGHYQHHLHYFGMSDPMRGDFCIETTTENDLHYHYN